MTKIYSLILLVNFFVGKKKDNIITILDGCDFYTKVGLQNLIDRCLLTINQDKKVMMHQLLIEMGREIIRQESPQEPGRHSRLCCHKDCVKVLRELRWLCWHGFFSETINFSCLHFLIEI